MQGRGYLQGGKSQEIRGVSPYIERRIIIENKLRQLREEKGWSVLQLSAKSGVPVETIRRMEEMENMEGVEPEWIIKVARPFEKFASEIFEKK